MHAYMKATEYPTLDDSARNLVAQQGSDDSLQKLKLQGNRSNYYLAY